MTSLFMPFANMHTQLLAALTDYSGEDGHLWRIKQRKTAAEYASYILRDITVAWKKQVCRGVRLRHSLKPWSLHKWKYSLVVMEPKWQPNGGQSCLEECGNTGWCQFCGGKGIGACCKRGGAAAGTDASECGQFDVPDVEEQICVHADCAQSNSRYEKIGWLWQSGKVEEETYNVTGASACQSTCQTAHLKKSVHAGKEHAPATAFNYKMKNGRCECMSGHLQGELKRVLDSKYISGPTFCPTFQTGSATEDEEAGTGSDVQKVPMQEIEIACNKSEGAKDVQDLEEKQPGWIKACGATAAAHIVKEFNPFYQRFAKFVERLSWMSGCGDADNDAGVAGVDENDWNAIVDFPFGKYSDCDWQKEQKRKDEDWMPDLEKKRGWFGQSRINMQEQAMMQTPYAAPGWLVRLMKKYNCLDRTARGDVGSGKSAVVQSIFSG
jgi:hypothetical protein